MIQKSLQTHLNHVHPTTGQGKVIEGRDRWDIGRPEDKDKEELSPTGSLHPLHRLEIAEAPGGAGAEGTLLPYWPKSQPLRS